MTIKSKADLLTSYANNNSGDISAADLRSLVQSINSSFGSMYVSSAVATTGMPLSSPVIAAGGFTAGSLVNFSNDGSNRLIYTGATNIHTHIACSASFVSNKDNAIVGLYVAKNGTALPAPALRTIANGSDIGSTAVHADVMLSQNDYIEIFVSINQISAPSVTLSEAYIFVQGMLV